MENKLTPYQKADLLLKVELSSILGVVALVPVLLKEAEENPASNVAEEIFDRYWDSKKASIARIEAIVGEPLEKESQDEPNV